jgi:hypothetical protein
MRRARFVQQLHVIIHSREARFARRHGAQPTGEPSHERRSDRYGSKKEKGLPLHVELSAAFWDLALVRSSLFSAAAAFRGCAERWRLAPGEALISSGSLRPRKWVVICALLPSFAAHN